MQCLIHQHQQYFQPKRSIKSEKDVIHQVKLNDNDSANVLTVPFRGS